MARTSNSHIRSVSAKPSKAGRGWPATSIDGQRTAVTDDDIRFLNELLEVVVDSMDGYRMLADSIQDVAVRALCWHRARVRRMAAEVLRHQIRVRNGTAPDEGSLLASPRRMFVGLRRFAPCDMDALLAELARLEAYAGTRFDKVLALPQLSAPARHAVTKARGLGVEDGPDGTPLKPGLRVQAGARA